MRIFIKFSIISVFIVVALFLFVINFNKTSVVTAKEEIDIKKIYLQNCARCHGADGKSQTELGIKLQSPDLTLKRIKKRSNSRVVKTITKGDGDMPAFGKKLSKEEINGLADFIKTL